MLEVVQAETSIQIQSFAYSEGQPWVQVEGRLLINSGIWVNFNTTVEIGPVFTKLEDFSDALAAAIADRSEKLRQESDNE